VLGQELPPLDAHKDDTDAPEDPRAEAAGPEAPVPAAAITGTVVEEELEAEEESELPPSVPSTGRRGRRARGGI